MLKLLACRSLQRFVANPLRVAVITALPAALKMSSSAAMTLLDTAQHAVPRRLSIAVLGASIAGLPIAFCGIFAALMGVMLTDSETDPRGPWLCRQLNNLASILFFMGWGGCIINAALNVVTCGLGSYAGAKLLVVQGQPSGSQVLC